MIFLVLPVYNEEKNIRSLILGLRKVMSGQEYRIIIVNDGSNDRSLDILAQLQGSDLIVEGYLVNMNIGAVFSTGIERALSESNNSDDILIIMESDLTSEFSLIKNLISEIEEKSKDIVIASRYQKGGGYRGFPIARRIFSFCANRLLRFYFPIAHVTDYTIFFRAYKIGIIKEAVRYFGSFGLIQSKGFVANAELLIKLSFFSRAISEVPFLYNYRLKGGASKIRIFRTINEYFVAILYLKNIFNKMKINNYFK